jgi:16S rRNA (guanine966-N2)-methyltransferase
MRIIRGFLKGRRINPPGNLPVRPTTDFAKEGLFNYLENKIELDGLKVLDLFSGTGNISLEFISRGASEVTSVDGSFKCTSFLKKTTTELNIKNIKISSSDVFRYVGFCKEKYDLIFADPPYDLNNAELLPGIIFSGELLLPGGLFILEHSDDRNFSAHPNFAEQRVYGKVNFSFFSLDKNK